MTYSDSSCKDCVIHETIVTIVPTLANSIVGLVDVLLRSITVEAVVSSSLGRDAGIACGAVAEIAEPVRAVVCFGGHWQRMTDLVVDPLKVTCPSPVERCLKEIRVGRRTTGSAGIGPASYKNIEALAKYHS